MSELMDCAPKMRYVSWAHLLREEECISTVVWDLRGDNCVFFESQSVVKGICFGIRVIWNGILVMLLTVLGQNQCEVP